MRPEELRDETVLQYLGYGGQTLDGAVLRQLAEGKARVCDAACPRTVYRVFPLEDGQLPDASLPLEGQDIRNHLAQCHHAVLLAATLGPEVERLLLRLQVQDMSAALVADACASAAIEAVCDALERSLQVQYRRQGCWLTDRFSPGYGDFPITVQSRLCQVLDTGRRIGLSVTPSALLTPGKSVTALMGVSDTPRPRRSRGCAACNLAGSCVYRKEGTTCGA